MKKKRREFELSQEIIFFATKIVANWCNYELNFLDRDMVFPAFPDGKFPFGGLGFLETAFVYLVYYTGSIWPSVLAHAINNLYALMLYKRVID